MALVVRDDSDDEFPAPVLQHFKCSLPGDPAVEVVAIPNLQCQWVVTDLLGNLFETNCKETLRRDLFLKRKDVVETVHEQIYPGESIPDLVPSKHEKERSEQDYPPQIYLKNKSVPTSLAFSWMVWAFSTPKRSSMSREKAWSFFKKLFQHCLEKAGTLKFRANCLGQPNAPSVEFEITSFNASVDPKQLWTRSVHNRFALEWNTRRLEETNHIQSNLTRPLFLDIVYFALSHNNKNGYLLKPMVFDWIAQFSCWVDENVTTLSMETTGFQDSLMKNKVGKNVALHESLWKGIDFALYENESSLLYYLRVFRFWSVQLIVLSFDVF